MSAVIGQSDYFGFDFRHSNENPVLFYYHYYCLDSLRLEMRKCAQRSKGGKAGKGKDKAKEAGRFLFVELFSDK